MNEQRMYGNGMFPPGASRLKQNETESLHHPAKRPPPPPPPRATAVTPSAAVKTSMTSSKQQLLAGYMAHEFRTKGTVLGHELEADRAVTTEMTAAPVNGNERYREITSLIMMKSDGGAHIPGVVNPAQLARWIQM
ncbi:hypothetical protein SSX86_031502 [Deinandra increscens subsp. villosa]|uniref:Uncharacterized protein n=1 Tax=Deinandra increscens subsp. villosa TaxID=3103831 RepID=A0AAP0GHL9_9ASTR